jgi:uncharacterized membrane protein
VNFRKLSRIACVFLLIFFSQGDALAATIHGTVYEWNSFKPLNNTVIDVNSTPEQYFVATDANYSFNLTPGTYLISADYFEGKKLVYTAEESVVISSEGEYVHDLLLFPPFPPYDVEPIKPSESNISAPIDTTPPTSQSNSENVYPVFALIVFIIVTLVGVYLLSQFLKKRNKKPPEMITSFPDGDGFSGRNKDLKRLEAGTPIKEAVFSEEAKNDSEESFDNSTEEVEFSEEAENDSEEGFDDSFEIHSTLPASTGAEEGDSQEDRKTNLPDDLRELLDLIRNSGNRITQRELRKKSPYSESKVSLMLSDLEERGLIEKFKRGRGNIIRIPDEHISKQTEDEGKQE